MGIQNRQRRAAKARKRKATSARRGPTTNPPPSEAGRQRGAENPRFGAGPGQASETPPFEGGPQSAVAALRTLILHWSQSYRSPIDAELYQRHPERLRRVAVNELLRELVGDALDRSWTAADLREAIQRKAPSEFTAMVGPVVRAEAERRGQPDPEWPGADEADVEHARWQQAEPALIGVLVVLRTLPLGAAQVSAPAAGGFTVDERVLRRVRALLAKAEASMFEEEAQACTAKAQELMTRYAIERTWAEAGDEDRRAPVSRRIWLDAPYVNAKSLLVAAVARSNHCTSVLSSDWGFVTVVGHAEDLDLVELLSTSLLVQAAHALSLAGSHTTGAGVSRTRSFRQSFLVAYAGRIGERLREAAAGVEAAADAERGGALLPVLASKDHAVRDAVSAMFPDVVSKEVSVSNWAGWGAGRAAADLAELQLRPVLPYGRAG